MASARWKTFAGLAGKGLGGAFAGGAVLSGCVGVYGSRSINSRRQRWFSDNFVLTPESLRLPYKQVKIETADGVELNGWYIEQTSHGKPSDRVVLCCNPYNQDKSNLLGVARGLWDQGYSCLLFDFRSHAPEPHAQSIGYLEKRDAHAALDWLCANKPPDARIALVGASMGGAMALTLAAENRPEVVAAATDCAFSSLKEVVGVRLDRMFPTTRLFGLDSIMPLHKLFLESICLVNQFWYGYNPANVGPKKLLQDIRVPLLIVHSEKDSIVPLSQGIDIYKGAASDDKHFVVVKGAEHIGSYYLNQKEYIQRQVNFFNECFKNTAQEVSPFVTGYSLLNQQQEQEQEQENSQQNVQ